MYTFPTCDSCEMNKLCMLLEFTFIRHDSWAYASYLPFVWHGDLGGEVYTIPPYVLVDHHMCTVLHVLWSLPPYTCRRIYGFLSGTGAIFFAKLRLLTSSRLCIENIAYAVLGM